MDALRLGRSLRALRIRRGLRQLDVATSAGMSRSQAARIERGELRGVALDDVVAIAAALGAELDLRVRWHGEALDRLLDAHHAALVDAMVARLGTVGWERVVEASFNVFGERGSVDVLAFHPGSASLLVVEVKSVIPDAQSLLSSHDRKVRLATAVASERGWKPCEIAKLLVVPDGTTARRRVAALDATFAVAYPDRARRVRTWLRSPDGRLAGLLFLPYDRGGVIGRRAPGQQRVTRPRHPATASVAVPDGRRVVSRERIAH